MERAIEIILEGRPINSSSQSSTRQSPSHDATTIPASQNSSSKLSEDQFRPNLPPDFLRMPQPQMSVPQQQQQHAAYPSPPPVPQGGVPSMQAQQDELLARQLQRKYYHQAMRDQQSSSRARHSSSASRRSQQQASRRSNSQHSTATSNASGGYGSSQNSQSGSSTFKNKLSNLSDVAKKRLTDFKKRFAKKKNSSQQEYSRKSLLDGDTEFNQL